MWNADPLPASDLIRRVPPCSSVMYRIDVIGDLDEPEGPGTAAFEISTVFTDLGADLTVEAPAGVEVLDLGDFGIEDGDFGTDEED